MLIREAKKSDLEIITKMASILYRSPYDELEPEMEELLNDDKNVFFLACEEEVIGFINGSLRTDYVEGSSTSPTGYIEGIYVGDAYRNQGVAKALVNQVAAWAKNKGCIELASDVEDFNKASIEFHKAIGLEEVNRLVCFIKKI